MDLQAAPAGEGRDLRGEGVPLRSQKAEGGRRQLLGLVAVLFFLLPLAAASAQEPLPPQGTPPPGANDFSCKPPSRHPYPVVLVHGTFGDMTVSWNEVAPALERLGYCVFALDYGNNATGDIPTSARQLRTFVDQVLSATHASKVSIVGHSQGGMMPRYLIKFLGGANQVDDLVGLSPSNHGTTNPLAGPAGQFGCTACVQQIAGSDFLNNLNAGDQTPAPVSYTVVETSHDEVVTPYQSEFLPANDRVTNVLLQDRCPSDPTEHVGIIYDPVAIQWALDALGRPGPADPNFAPDCSGVGLATFPDSSSAGGGGSSASGGETGAKLVIGHLPRHARTTRKRRLRIAVAARHGSVADVVVRIRSAKTGRVLGRSHKTTVKGRRSVVVKLKRPLGRGNYNAIATGRKAAASRSFKLR